MKAYILSKWNRDYDDGGDTVGIYFSKKKIDEDILKLNEPYNLAEERQETCEKCRGKNDDNNRGNKEKFELEKTCKFAKISEDRNGRYCENDKSNNYNISEFHYNCEETDVLNLPKSNLDEVDLIKLEVKTVLKVKNNITELDIDKIKTEFEETAWANDDSIYQPKVVITKL